jgi:hypothetical protein
MNLKKLISIFWCLPLLVAGCATPQNPAAYYPDTPLTENFSPTYQKKLNASAHWEIIASDLASQLQASLVKNNLQDKPIFLNLASDKTLFSRAFHEFLTTQLVKKGLNVTRDKLHSTIYNYKIQPIKYASSTASPLASKFKWTMLATGLIVVRDIADSLDLNKDILAAGIAADAWSTESDSRLELIISTSIINRDVYIYRTTDIYYANSEDIHLYQQQLKAGKKNNVFDDPFYNLN